MIQCTTSLQARVHIAPSNTHDCTEMEGTLTHIHTHQLSISTRICVLNCKYSTAVHHHKFRTPLLADVGLPPLPPALAPLLLLEPLGVVAIAPVPAAAAAAAVCIRMYAWLCECKCALSCTLGSGGHCFEASSSICM